MFKSEFLNFQDRLFVIKRIIKEEDRPIIDTWKEYLQADTVLKREGLLYFLESVADLEIIQ
jgi:hypothetical protein